MTSEDDFQRALDANPDDYQTRLVFADWLQERADPRAEGYRALGAMRRVPQPWTNGENPGVREGANEWTFWQWTGEDEKLPQDWFVQILRVEGERGTNYRQRTTRRAIEDAAALAFAKLPPERRAELLASDPGRHSL